MNSDAIKAGAFIAPVMPNVDGTKELIDDDLRSE
jgi:hypothetical protein